MALHRILVRLLVLLLSGVGTLLLSVWFVIREDLRAVRTVLRANAKTEVPPRLLAAVVAAEDPCHFQHPRTHTVRTAVSVFLSDELERANGAFLHASMANQIVRAQMRRPAAWRPGREVLVVAFIEATEDPAEIVKTYVGTAYFGRAGGQDISGASEAARFYFDKSAADLDVAECATLAAALRSPNALRPDVRSARAIRRRLAVLAEMRRLQFISERELAIAVRKVAPL